MIKIDGSYLEGGGQILRTASAFSIITKKPCHIFNIRKGRKKPGLMTQHLLGLRALAKLCNGKLEGDKIYSEEIKFFPGEIKEKVLNIEIPTAGSITLILQSLIPVGIKNGIKIIFNGGATDTFFSPTLDYFRYVFLEILKRFGLKVKLNVLKRGFYPKGGAKVKVEIYPSQIEPIFLLERGKLEEITIISGASRDLKLKKVAERQIESVIDILSFNNLLKSKVKYKKIVEYYDTDSSGSQINIIGKFTHTIMGADNLGEIGKTAEKVGKEAAINFLEELKSESTVDKYLSDQILPYMALAGKGAIKVKEITSHCKTNIWVIEKFLDKKFKIKDNKISFGVER